MKNDNLKIWDAVKQPPPSALRQIQAGRLKGKTDINPQWRYQAMTEQFGVCGIGWKYEVARVWNEPATENQVFAFAEVLLYVKIGDAWSDGIPGIGGSMLVTKESSGLHASDEGYKMAITDALSVAMKMIGIASDVYAGLWDGSKYRNGDEPKPKFHPEPEHPKEPKVVKTKAGTVIDAEQWKELALAKEGLSDENVAEILGEPLADYINAGKSLPEATEKIKAVNIPLTEPMFPPED